MNHRLLYLKRRIHWERWALEGFSRTNRVFKHEKLLLSLLLLKRLFGYTSFQQLLEDWESEYSWQYLAGIEYLGKELPILSSDLNVVESMLGEEFLYRFMREFRQLEREEFHYLIGEKDDSKADQLVSDYLVQLNS